MIGKTLAHYNIVAKIGTGGMGEVYRARDTKLNRGSSTRSFCITGARPTFLSPK